MTHRPTLRARPPRPPRRSSRRGPMPDYRDDIVRQTARMRQRPAWTFPERWLPVSVITHPGDSRPHRSAGGSWASSPSSSSPSPSASRSSRAPGRRCRHRSGRPPTASSHIESGGDIFTADPVTGVAKAVVDRHQTGPAAGLLEGRHPHRVRAHEEAWRRSPDRRPVRRQRPRRGDARASDRSRLRRADRSAQYTFSPDGTEIALWSTADAGGRALDRDSRTEAASGSSTRPIIVGEAAYRPPDGAELIVAVKHERRPEWHLRHRHQDGNAQDDRRAAAAGFGVGLGRVSPDGSRLAYVTSAPWTMDPSSYRVHVIGLDGTHDVKLPMPPGAVFQDAPPGRTTGRAWPSPAVMPNTTRTWCSPWSPPMDPAVGVESDAPAHRLLRHDLPMVARRHVDPGDARGIRDGAAGRPAPPARPVDRRARPGAVGGEQPARLAANRSLDGRPRTGVRPAHRRTGAGPGVGSNRSLASSRPAVRPPSMKENR